MILYTSHEIVVGEILIEINHNIKSIEKTEKYVKVCQYKKELISMVIKGMDLYVI